MEYGGSVAVWGIPKKVFLRFSLREHLFEWFTIRQSVSTLTGARMGATALHDPALDLAMTYMTMGNSLEPLHQLSCRWGVSQ